MFIALGISRFSLRRSDMLPAYVALLTECEPFLMFEAINILLLRSKKKNEYANRKYSTAVSACRFGS